MRRATEGEEERGAGEGTKEAAALGGSAAEEMGRTTDAAVDDDDGEGDDVDTTWDVEGKAVVRLAEDITEERS